MSDLYDITTVCKLLGTTSRTLRYYEQQGIINNASAKEKIHRQYTSEQITYIKKVFVLRSLGLSVKSIKELLKNNIDLGTVIKEKRTSVIAQISTKQHELEMLHEVLCVIENDGDIFSEKTDLLNNNPDTIISGIADKCTNFLLTVNLCSCYKYFTVNLAEYMPISVLEKVWVDSIETLGNYVITEKVVIKENIVIHFLRYEKLGLKIKYVFNNGSISGFWIDYYEKI